LVFDNARIRKRSFARAGNANRAIVAPSLFPRNPRTMPMPICRRTLSRAESLELLERRRELQREAMTPADIDALMRKTINEALDQVGAVSRDDLLRANVPAEAIDMHFREVMAEVIAQRGKEGIRA
jgi:hypothetical protein